MKRGTYKTMTTEFTDAIVHGIGVAISPLVIIVLVMILLSPHAISNGITFLVGWLSGLIVLGVIVFTQGGFGGLAGDAKSHGVIDIVFGILLLALALRGWRRRKKKHGSGKLFSAADNFTILKAAIAGFFFAAIYPKNLILTVATASELATAGGYRKIETYILFIAIASVTIAGPVFTCIWGGERIRPFLARAKEWLVAHNQLILILVLIFFGLKLVIQGGVSLAGG